MTEILRDEQGRILPGQQSLNPSGRRNASKLNALIDKAFPEEFIVSYFYSKLLNLNTDKSNKKDILKTIKDKEFRKTFKQFLKDLPEDNSSEGNPFFAGLSEMDRINLLKDIWNRRYGKPKEVIETDNTNYNVNRDITVELVKSESNES